MSKLSPRALFIIALIISLIGAFLMYNQLNKTSKEGIANIKEVIVATEDIPSKMLITEKMITTARLPIETVQKGAFSSVQDVLGKYSKVTIAKGEQITGARLNQNERGAGLVAVLPPDKRAITVGVTDTTGLTGLAKAGDRVDIISVKSYSGNVSGQILLQDVMIMAINRTELNESVPEEKNGKIEKLATVTLAVQPKDAVLLALAQAQGTLQLILRPLAPTEEFVNNTLVVEQGGGANSTPRQEQTNNFGIRVIKGSESRAVTINLDSAANAVQVGTNAAPAGSDTSVKK